MLRNGRSSEAPHGEEGEPGEKLYEAQLFHHRWHGYNQLKNLFHSCKKALFTFFFSFKSVQVFGRVFFCLENGKEDGGK